MRACWAPAAAASGGDGAGLLRGVQELYGGQQRQATTSAVSYSVFPLTSMGCLFLLVRLALRPLTFGLFWCLMTVGLSVVPHIQC